METFSWLGIGLGAFFSLIAGTVAWKRGFFLRIPETKKSPIRWQEVFIALFLFYFVQFLFVGLLTSLQKYLQQQTRLSPLALFGWVYLGIILLTMALLLLYVFALETKKREWIFYRKHKSRTGYGKSFCLGILSWFLAYPLLLLVSQSIAWLVDALYPHVRYEQNVVDNLQKLVAYPTLFWTTGLILTTCVPFLEELVFRGFLQNGLGRIFSWRNRIVLSSFFFALFHLSGTQGIENGEIFISIFLFSLFLGYVYERENTLWAPVGLHMMFNGMSFLFLILRENKVF